MNFMRKSYVEKDDFMKQIMLGLDPVTAHRSTLNFSDPEVVARVDSYDYNEMTLNASHTLEEMITSCKWQSKEVTCVDYITKTLTALGHCYTFNSAEYIHKNGRLTVSRTGISAGLQLTINVQQDEYFVQIGYSAGIRVGIPL